MSADAMARLRAVADSASEFSNGESCVLVDDLRALLDAHDEALDALADMTPRPGFPKCDRRCASNGGHPEEQGWCDCGFEEIRNTAEKCRAVLAKAGRR